MTAERKKNILGECLDGKCKCGKFVPKTGALCYCRVCGHSAEVHKGIVAKEIV